MPALLQPNLKVILHTGTRVEISVSVTIQWSEVEGPKAWTLWFLVVEQDGDVDHFDIGVNSFKWEPKDGADEPFMFHRMTVVRPDSNGNTVHEFSRNWLRSQFPQKEVGREEFQARCWLVPMKVKRYSSIWSGKISVDI